MTGRTLAMLSNRIEIEKASLPQGALAELRACAEIPNPAFEEAARRNAGRFNAHERVISSLEETDTAISLPRGMTTAVRQVVPDVRFVDRRFRSAPYAFTVRGVAPRPYQAMAVRAAVLAQQGLLLLPTGAGKSLVMVLSIAALRQWALVIVPTLDLVEQMVRVVRDALGVEAALVAGGECSFGPVTIATWQALQDPEILARSTATFGAVFFDEVHLAGAGVPFAIVDAFPAAFRVGVTGTPRDDGLWPRVEQLFGKVLFRLAYADLTDAGYLEALAYRQVTTGFRFEYGGPPDWHPLLKALVENEERNNLIADLAFAESDGRVVLVLTGRKDHARIQGELIAARGRRVRVVTGSMTKKARTEALDAARAGEVDVLIATQLADMGLDLPILSRLILAFPSKSEPRLLQRAGRIIRPMPGKPAPVVIDITDPHVGPLAHQARGRRRLFARTWGDVRPPEAA